MCMMWNTGSSGRLYSAENAEGPRNDFRVFGGVMGCTQGAFWVRISEGLFWRGQRQVIGLLGRGAPGLNSSYPGSSPLAGAANNGTPTSQGHSGQQGRGQASNDSPFGSSLGFAGLGSVGLGPGGGLELDSLGGGEPPHSGRPRPNRP